MTHCLSARPVSNSWTDWNWKVFASMLIFLTSISGSVLAQEITVSGKVTSSDDGSPLPGVTVLQKGSSNGTSTDVEGNFRLNVSDAQGTLVFSFIGYTPQEIPINSRTRIDVVLASDITQLSEVVVIGYGEVKRSNVTGSIVSVKSEDLTRVPVTNVMESLQGNVPGMDITRTSGAAGGTINVRVRGQRSLTASSEPLFIVDGVQYSSIQDLNPNDIQSMEVLKDAASTAIYGSRGANGVILITTKKGSEGKTKVGFSMYTGIAEINGYPEVQNGEEYANQRREANRATGDWNSPADDAAIFGPTELENINQGKSTDWQDLLLQKGAQQDYLVSVTTGTDKTSFYVSANYFQEKGLFKNDVLNRYSLRANLDHSISKMFKVGIQNQFTYYDQDIRRDPLNTANKLSPLENSHDDQGEVIAMLNNNKTVNPLMDMQDDNYTNNVVTSRIFTSAYLEAKPLRDLTFRSIFGVTNTNTRTGIFANSLSVERNAAPALTSYRNMAVLNLNLENILTYKKQFGDHAITATAVQSFLQNKTEIHFSSGVNQLIPAQSFYGLSNANEQVTAQAEYEEAVLLSYTGRLQYDFREKYLLTLGIRTDGASQLSPGRKWDVFPSVSAAWRVLEENFMSDVSTLTDLKVRASYGIAGNYAVRPYATQSNLVRMPFAYDETLAVGYSIGSTLGNNDLGWEISSTVNAGIDIGVLQNRITATVDLFKTKTDDLLLERLLPTTTGASRIFQNIGKTETKGLEIALNTVPVSTDELVWKVGLSWFTTREKITALASGSNDVANKWFIGHPTQAFYDYEKTGIWQLDEADEANKYGQVPGEIKVKDQNTDDAIDTNNDRIILGSPRPKWIGSITSDIHYRNFDFSFQVFARWGQMIQYSFANIYDPQGNENSIKHDYWTPENPTNDYPRPNAGLSKSSMDYISTLLYRDGSFIKLRGITLGYTMPKALLEKTPFSSVRFYVNAKNLFTYSKIDNYDPERGGSENTPLSRLYVAGINVTF